MALIDSKLIEIKRSEKMINFCDRFLSMLLPKVASLDVNSQLTEAFVSSTSVDFQVPASCLSEIASMSKDHEAVLKWFESGYQHSPLEYNMAMFYALGNPKYSELFEEVNLVPRFVSVNQNGIIINFAIAGTAITPRAFFQGLNHESTSSQATLRHAKQSVT